MINNVKLHLIYLSAPFPLFYRLKKQGIPQMLGKISLHIILSLERKCIKTKKGTKNFPPTKQFQFFFSLV